MLMFVRFGCLDCDERFLSSPRTNKTSNVSYLFILYFIIYILNILFCFFNWCFVVFIFPGTKHYNINIESSVKVVNWITFLCFLISLYRNIEYVIASTNKLSFLHYYLYILFIPYFLSQWLRIVNLCVLCGFCRNSQICNNSLN